MMRSQLQRMMRGRLRETVVVWQLRGTVVVCERPLDLRLAMRNPHHTRQFQSQRILDLLAIAHPDLKRKLCVRGERLPDLIANPAIVA